MNLYNYRYDRTFGPVYNYALPDQTKFYCTIQCPTDLSEWLICIEIEELPESIQDLKYENTVLLAMRNRVCKSNICHCPIILIPSQNSLCPCSLMLCAWRRRNKCQFVVFGLTHKLSTLIITQAICSTVLVSSGYCILTGLVV